MTQQAFHLLDLAAQLWEQWLCTKPSIEAPNHVDLAGEEVCEV
ncbi:hypothetical protein ACFWP3_19000 [Streptomyces sp. NPDC058525]